MKLTKFKADICFDPQNDYWVNFIFTYGDGNYGDSTMPHEDEIWEIHESTFSPPYSEKHWPENYTFENLLMDHEGDWQEIE
jgi:hypothetical protein